MPLMYFRLDQSDCLSLTNVVSENLHSLDPQFSRKVCLLVLKTQDVKVKIPG